MVGMLVQKETDYNFFKSYFEHNWSQIQGCFEYELNFKDKKFIEVSNNGMMSLFFPFFIGCMAILMLIACFGGVYEYRRRRTVKNGGNGVILYGDENEETDL